MKACVDGVWHLKTSQRAEGVLAEAVRGAVLPSWGSFETRDVWALGEVLRRF